MGILSALRLSRSVAADPQARRTGRTGIRSPWTQGELTKIAWSDIHGIDYAPITRTEAMRVPSIAKARAVLVGAIARHPLVALTVDGPVPVQPTWLQRTDGAIAPWHRMAWTVDDHLFYGWSLWAVARGADRSILSAERIPPEWWRFGGSTGIEVYDARSDVWNEANPDEVLAIPGPGEGLLENGAQTVRAAIDLEASWSGRVRNPIPTVELHQTTENPLKDEEIDALLDDYIAARRDPDGALIYTPHDIEFKTHGESSADLFTEGRNAIRLDVANFTGLPGAALDGALATASLTYVTQDGKRSELADSVDYWTDPIAARLSQDDVVPRGTRVRFDKTDSYTPSPTGPITED